MVRSGIEYSSVIYGGFLTQTQADELERLQATSLGIIWGWNKSYADCLKLLRLETLEHRRRPSFERFTLKAYQNPIFREKWFPRRNEDAHALRSRRPLLEEKPKHERLARSPISRLRKVVNDLAGERKKCCKIENRKTLKYIIIINMGFFWCLCSPSCFIINSLKKSLRFGGDDL